MPSVLIFIFNCVRVYMCVCLGKLGEQIIV